MPADVDVSGFEANLEECSVALKEVVAYLRTAAQHAGADVTQRRYKHPTPNTGWGVTYYAGGSPFHVCELHPKRDADRLWGSVRGADPVAVTADGFRPSKQEGWFQIHTMREAVRFVRWIVWAHDTRA
jgi:hypothetical protein